MKKLLLIITSFIITGVILYTSFIPHLQASNISDEYEYYYNDNTILNEDSSVMSTNSMNDNNAVLVHPAPIDTVKDSATVLVNKEYSLPDDYVPTDLVVPDILFNINYYDEKKLLRQEAATAMEDLFSAALEKGLTLYGISGYRSYARQEQIYNTNIRTKGEDYTNRYSAKPGFSEHQTGLVLDVSTASIANRLEPVFAYTPEGKWLAENAYKYGFIIRYPKEKESITGYSYEPWHLRYVGKELAKYLYDNHLSLEEYYGYTNSNSTNSDISYDNVVDIDETTDKKEIAEPTPEEIEKVSHSEGEETIDDSKKEKIEIQPEETKSEKSKQEEPKSDENSSKEETVINKNLTKPPNTDDFANPEKEPPTSSKNENKKPQSPTNSIPEEKEPLPEDTSNGNNILQDILEELPTDRIENEEHTDENLDSANTKNTEETDETPPIIDIN